MLILPMQVPLLFRPRGSSDAVLDHDAGPQPQTLSSLLSFVTQGPTVWKPSFALVSWLPTGHPRRRLDGMREKSFPSSLLFAASQHQPLKGCSLGSSQLLSSASLYAPWTSLESIRGSGGPSWCPHGSQSPRSGSISSKQ